ncbi:MAG: TerB family tellurite resistance protein [Crocinitomicaceae bacterium]|nr:TerB family tellurite resistance protein [Crocinitomicaceae bacterium]
MYGLILGFVFYYITKSFFGSLFGFFVGSYIDNLQRAKRGQQNGESQYRGRSAEEIRDYFQQRASRSDVPTILMALSAAVMKADGKVLKVELDYVKAFFRQQFGDQFNTQHLQSLRNYLDSDILLNQICSDVRLHLRPESRIQLIHYLFGIANVDGNVSQSELQVIADIAYKMGIPQVDFDSVKNMFFRDANSDYKILGITENASDDEVKKAYRQMAIKFHPDKVAQMGEEFQKGAKEKFQKIQEAYENIKKNRGMK